MPSMPTAAHDSHSRTVSGVVFDGHRVGGADCWRAAKSDSRAARRRRYGHPTALVPDSPSRFERDEVSRRLARRPGCSGAARLESVLQPREGETARGIPDHQLTFLRADRCVSSQPLTPSVDHRRGCLNVPVLVDGAGKRTHTYGPQAYSAPTCCGSGRWWRRIVVGKIGGEVAEVSSGFGGAVHSDGAPERQ